MPVDFRLKLISALADATIGNNMADTIGASAVLLLSALNSAKYSASVPEPQLFVDLRRDLLRVLAACAWDDIEIEILSGRLQ